MRLSALLAALYLVAFTVTGAAYWQSRDQSFVSGATYTGPLDLVSGGVVWYSTDRCGSTSYTGNVADIYAPADASHTLVTCSSGGTVNETLQSLATTCAVSCTVKTLYDQVGTNCSGSPCNLAQATEASRPAATASALGSKYCSTFATISTMTATAGSQIAQPWTGSTVAKGTAGGNIDLLNGVGGTNGNVQLIFATASSLNLFFAGNASNTFTMTTNAFHATQWLATNGGSDSVYIDGSSTAGLTAGTNPVGTAIGINNQQNGTGVFCEGGFWTGNFSGGQQSNINSNQHGSTNNGWNF